VSLTTVKDGFLSDLLEVHTRVGGVPGRVLEAWSYPGSEHSLERRRRRSSPCAIGRSARRSHTALPRRSKCEAEPGECMPMRMVEVVLRFQSLVGVWFRVDGILTGRIYAAGARFALDARIPSRMQAWISSHGA
jgi:hypothetical protein